jgi:ATP-dependent phosphoenolpyruvate carboxykinase
MAESGATLLVGPHKTASPLIREQQELTVDQLYRNLPASSLYEHAIRYEKDASIAGNGALVAYSGVKTGRSPRTSGWSSIPTPKRTCGGDR